MVLQTDAESHQATKNHTAMPRDMEGPAVSDCRHRKRLKGHFGDRSPYCNRNLQWRYLLDSFGELQCCPGQKPPTVRWFVASVQLTLQLTSEFQQLLHFGYVYERSGRDILSEPSKGMEATSGEAVKLLHVLFQISKLHRAMSAALLLCFCQILCIAEGKIYIIPWHT